MKNSNNFDHTEKFVENLICGRMTPSLFDGGNLIANLQEIVKVQDEIEDSRRVCASRKHLSAVYERLELMWVWFFRIENFPWPVYISFHTSVKANGSNLRNLFSTAQQTVPFSSTPSSSHKSPPNNNDCEISRKLSTRWNRNLKTTFLNLGRQTKSSVSKRIYGFILWPSRVNSSPRSKRLRKKSLKKEL